MKINFRKLNPMTLIKKIELSRCAVACKDLSSKTRTIWEKVSGFIRAILSTKIAKITGIVLVYLLVAAAVFELVVFIMIFSFKVDNKLTKFVGKYVPYPIAVVNYDFITYRDYKAETDYIHHFYQATQQEVDLKTIDSQILNQLIEDKIILEEARLNNISVKNQEIDATINGIVDQNGGRAQVEKVLNDLYGLNVNQFKRLVKNQLLRDKVDNTLISRVSARHILIKVDQSANEEQINAGKAKITDIHGKIAAGLDFGEAAKQFSEDTNSAEQNGSLEPFARGEMVKEFEDAAFATKVGEISAPVKTVYGWHIIKVEARTGKIDKSFADWISDLKKNFLILKFYSIY